MGVREHMPYLPSNALCPPGHTTAVPQCAPGYPSPEPATIP